MRFLSSLLYHLVILPLSRLPFPVLYRISDCMFVLFFYVTGYRKKIVMDNIRNSFPGKSSTEHKHIAKKFYRHFCDLVAESIKAFTISEREIHKRMICTNAGVADKYFDSGQSIILAGGHYNNWELLAVAVHDMIKHQPVGIYMPLKNKYFDRKMQETRSRYGLKMISVKSVRQFFESERKNLNGIIFAIDQSPSNPAKGYWTKFLNQDTCVLTGTERYAVEFNYPVVFGRLKKLKRGHYSLGLEVVCDKPQETDKGEITEKVTAMLERDILSAPEFWLWSHRRWKHKKL